MTYSEKLNSVRKKRGYTLRKLSDESHINASYLSEILRGYDVPTEEEHKLLEEILSYKNHCRRVLDKDAFKSKSEMAYTTYILHCIECKHKHDTIGRAGILVCPICHEHIIYMRNVSNGHSWGKCETEGCIGWMM